MLNFKVALHWAIEMFTGLGTDPPPYDQDFICFNRFQGNLAWAVGDDLSITMHYPSHFIEGLRRFATFDHERLALMVLYH